MIIIVMGVSGCGKTTFAEALHEKLGWPLVEADNHHSSENKTKMGRGIPLSDHDRFPWLLSLSRVISRWKETGQNGILTCSALKRMYRDILLTGRVEIHTSAGNPGTLDVSPDTPTANRETSCDTDTVSGKPTAETTDAVHTQSVNRNVEDEDQMKAVTCEHVTENTKGHTGREMVVFAHLHGSPEVICQRLGQRSGHFMPSSLLRSQYQTLEMPDPMQERVVQLSVENSLNHNIDFLCKSLSISS